MSDVQNQAAETKQARRRSAQQVLAANRRSICATSFDFLGGSFQKAARVRLVSIIVAGIVVAANLAIVGAGLSKMIEANATRSQTARLGAEYAQQAREFGAATGLTVDQNSAYLQRDELLTGQLRAIMTSQHDIGGLIEIVTSVPGVRITTLEIATATPEAGNQSLVVPFSVTAESTDFEQLRPWVEALQSNKTISGASVVREGRNLTVTATYTAPQAPEKSLKVLSDLNLTAQPAADPAAQAGQTAATNGAQP